MITSKQAKALSILDAHPDSTARSFGERYFDAREQEYLHTAMSNQGNGACAGKKAWLCAGSLLGRLAKRGLVRHRYVRERWVYTLTLKGEEALMEYNKAKN